MQLKPESQQKILNYLWANPELQAILKEGDMTPADHEPETQG